MCNCVLELIKVDGSKSNNEMAGMHSAVVLHNTMMLNEYYYGRKTVYSLKVTSVFHEILMSQYGIN